MEAAIRQIIADFQEAALPHVVPRTVHVPEVPGRANVITGARRSGKTYLLYQLMEELIRRGVPKTCILYMNFEDERLAGLRLDQMHLVTDSFFRMFPESRRRRSWLFFDEIQNVSGWERYVRRLLDSEDVRIFLTGSSSKLLSREIATSMRGRAVETRLLPFSFAEFLRAQGIVVPSDLSLVGKELRSTLEHQVGRYLVIGGFPEVRDLSPLDRRQVLQEYVDVAVFRDVVQRYRTTNLVLLKDLIRRIVANPACPFSASRFVREARSRGLHCVKGTVLEYLEYLSDCFLVFPVELFTESIKRRQVNPRKLYPVDPGLAAAFRFVGREPQGTLLETAVFLELQRRRCQVGWYRTRSGWELDFVSQSPEGRIDLIQVSADISSEDTLGREVRALAMAARELRSRSGAIVSLTQEARFEVDGCRIEVIPAWRWLLSAPDACPARTE